MKGRTNNPNGRPKGATNKSTQRVKMVLSEIFDSEYTPEKISEYLEVLDGMDKLRFLIQILPYLTPKCRPVEPEREHERGFNSIDLSSLSNGDLKVLQGLKSKIDITHEY